MAVQNLFWGCPARADLRHYLVSVAWPKRLWLSTHRRADHARRDRSRCHRARAGVRIPSPQAGLCTSPASTAQARIDNDVIKSRGIPCGSRIQFDPSKNLDSLKLSRSGRAIMLAHQNARWAATAPSRVGVSTSTVSDAMIAASRRGGCLAVAVRTVEWRPRSERQRLL
jgi:hypothetical protein